MIPKVSIVTCSHNRPDLLRAAVQSVRDQTDPDWEHLIYDDASTDPRVSQVLNWAQSDPRVRVWRGYRNLDQPSILWNFMFDRAHGRYFTVLDDDNMKLPMFIERMAGILDSEPDVGVVTCGWRVDAEHRTEPYYLNLSTCAERLENLSTCDGGAMLYRRELFERAGYFSEELRTNEDWDWLRRAVHLAPIKNLQEIHSTYRSHNASRMVRSQVLGSDGDAQKVKSRNLYQTLKVVPAFPPNERLTASQRDVCESLRYALDRKIPWVTQVGADSHNGLTLALVVSPFQQTDDEIDAAVAPFPNVLIWHMEDPYALRTNLERVFHLAKTHNVWVCTNDASTVAHYRTIVGERVIVCASLSASDDSNVWCRAVVPRDIDVLLCGFAYPSRRRFMDDFLPRINGRQVSLVGDGWGSYASDTVTVSPTLPLRETYYMHARARAVVCLQRVHGDCFDGPVEPQTLNRGFMEGFSGARVFVDSSRPRHSLDRGDVEWYRGSEDLVPMLLRYLDSPNLHPTPYALRCGQLYTYRTRLARVLNCVRSPRYMAEIP